MQILDKSCKHLAEQLILKNQWLLLLMRNGEKIEEKKVQAELCLAASHSAIGSGIWDE